VQKRNSNINSSSIKEKQEVRIINISTMCKYLIICILLVFFVDKSSAQIAIAVAKEENYPFSAIEWRVEWGYGNYSDAELHSMKYLEAKGYKKVYNQVLDKELFKLTKGYWVVVKSERKDDGKQITSFGLGVSADSYENAEKNAIINLADHDWNWKKSFGYKVDKMGLFNEAPQKQLIYIIKSRKSVCGDNAYDISYMLGTYENTMYQKIYKGFKRQNSDASTTVNVVSHIIRDNGIVGILKCNQKCSDGSTRSIYKVVDCNTEAELKQMAPYDNTIVSASGEIKYFIYKTIDLREKENSSIFNETYKLLRDILGVPNQPLLDKWGSSGIRG